MSGFAVGDRVKHWHSQRAGIVTVVVPTDPEISEYAPRSYHVRWEDGPREVELVPGNQLVAAPAPAPEPPPEP